MGGASRRDRIELAQMDQWHPPDRQRLHVVMMAARYRHPQGTISLRKQNRVAHASEETDPANNRIVLPPANAQRVCFGFVFVAVKPLASIEVFVLKHKVRTSFFAVSDEP